MITFGLLPKLYPRHLSWVLAVWFGLTAMSSGIVLYDTANPTTNTTAPAGIYSDSGWAYQGKFGSFLGTMIGEQYFITAQHIGGQGTSFVSGAEFNGVVDVTYTIDTAANGGAGYWNITGTDLRIYKINETFSSWAELYTGNSELGKTLVTFGRGGVRGAEVTLGPTVHGWSTSPADGIARWGVNEVTGIYNTAVGQVLGAQFNAIAGQNEATLSSGDSGGAVFIQDGGQWKLAGINYGVDGKFDTNNTPGDSKEFEAALFDKGGFYEGSDSSGWSFATDTGLDKPSSMYASRISASATEIMAIVTVPEPGSLLLLAMAGAAMLRRRRQATWLSARQR